ncbi:MAG TPA: hypothetical protein VJC10_03505 [Patescibacteria group bacterium]|nr:hypothetical protein [Patescibacteria group bacterium]
MIEARQRGIKEAGFPVIPADRSWFDAHRLSESVIHLPLHNDTHTGNVMVLNDIIAQKKGLSNRARHILLYGASGHDILRETDDEDPGHGSRAADYIIEHGVRLGIPLEFILGVAFLVRNHDIPINKVPDLSAGGWVLLTSFKEGDKYERVRVDDLDVSRLAHQSLVSAMLPLALRLHHLTRVDLSWLDGRQLSPFEISIQAAIRLDAVRASHIL